MQVIVVSKVNFSVIQINAISISYNSSNEIYTIVDQNNNSHAVSKSTSIVQILL